MAGAAVAAIVVGTGISVYGQMEAGKNANKVAQRNAEIQLRDAEIAQRNSEFNAKIKEKEDDARRRRMVSDQGASGTVVNDGTNLLVLAEQEFIDDLNADLIRRGGKNQADSLRANAAVTSFSGKAQQSAANTGALGSLFTGLGSAGATYNSQKNAGAFD
jgi:hypothetical protein|tara:strand:+ start:4509 stop:4988 length:480 start_codon:yes stop_codon:yes gene_type:complete